MKNTATRRAMLKDFLSVLIWTLKTYWKIAPYRTSAMLIGRIFRDVNTLIFAYFLARILDQSISIMQQPNPSVSAIYPLLFLMFIIGSFGQLMSNSLYNYGRGSLRTLSSYLMEQIFYTKINSLSMENLEDPEFANQVKRSKEWMYDVMYILQETISMISGAITVIISGVIVFNTMPYLFPFVIFITIIRFFPQQKFMRENFNWYIDHTEDERKASETSSWLFSKARKLLEIRINSGFEYFDNKYRSFVEIHTTGLNKILAKMEINHATFDVVDQAMQAFIYAFLFMKVIAGGVTVGTTTFLVRTVNTFVGRLLELLSSISYMYDFCLKTTDLVKLLNLESSIKDGQIELKPRLTPPEIEFKNVSFKYPKTDKLIFNNLNLHIKSGEKVAIVGHNGAGKTTLVKLIARAYDTTSGDIFINGINIKDIKLASLYKQIGILFQDYNFYTHLSVKENIYVGKPDEPMDENRIVEAAINADADEFINEYKNGYDQLMSERFDGGTSPSGGQEQKIAIARFFYRNAPLAIFDEPTSAIDAVSEYKIFNRIYSFFENKTVIIISHRFSTVRNADRIIVMDHGKIVEEGLHNELIKMNGVYANAFRLQAEGYRN